MEALLRMMTEFLRVYGGKDCTRSGHRKTRLRKDDKLQALTLSILVSVY